MKKITVAQGSDSTKKVKIADVAALAPNTFGIAQRL
jgi:hypothetical protein